MSRRMRFLLLAIVAVLLIAVLILVVIYNDKEYVTLYSDLTSAQSAEVIVALESASIPYEVQNGKLLVEVKNEEKARLQLTMLNFTDPGYGYDIANSGGLMATQSDKDRNYYNQLQERMRAAIVDYFPEIASATVTISVPQRSAFALQTENTPASASIILKKQPGATLSAEQVQGIMTYVKTSVQGLTEENISIVDERGDLKTVLDLEENYNNKKLELTSQVSNQLSRAIESMLEGPYGRDHISVRAMAELNTDSRVTESTTYNPIDPENPTNNPLDYSEFNREKTGDGFPAVEGVVGDQDNIGTPQYAAEEAEAEESNYYSLHDVYDYLVSNTREQIIKDGFVIERASAAIVIDRESLLDGERDSIIALAANASGIAPENITVANLKFVVDYEPDTPTGDDIGRVVIFVGLGLLLFCIIMIIVLTAVSRKKKREAAAAEAAAAEAAAAEALLYDENGIPLIDLMNQEEEYEPIELQESQEQKLKMQIKDLAESDPEIVAQLIKTWLVSEN